MRLFILLTSCKEENTIGKAVEQIICPNRDLWPYLQLLIVSPDDPTLKEAENICRKYHYGNYRVIRDRGEGKSQALNIAFDAVTKIGSVNQEEDMLILTDGDMYLADNAIKNLLKIFEKADSALVGVGGHPVSLDSKKTMFGYYSHLFCAAAHKRRLANPDTPMSGYLYGIRPIKGIFPLPEGLHAEDAYISGKIIELGYKTAYAPDALAYVKFPKNLKDWFKQKTRSLGGNVQIHRPTYGSKTAGNGRSILQDLKMATFPLFFARNFRELLWSLVLYPLRLFLWVKIYYNHLFNRYKPGMWEQIESSK